MDEEDDREKRRNHSRSPSPDVKSTAIVKYTSVKCPVGFEKLQRNTDLKMPPSNWLSSATDSYGLRHALNRSAGFSSFRMAHMFPDCVGEVDVVSGAECIKSLLQLPYHQKSTISMIVHRVENTLLLDNFDIYQYLMKSERSWMKKFFYENCLKSISVEDRLTFTKNKSRDALQQKSLISKFLYHSLPSADLIDDYAERQPRTLPDPNLPDPDVKKNIPCPNFSNHTYNRNVVWTFEDIQMLIGSDMPIFGGVDRPCVSLRLQDASEPINVLTGIDYWLDNLMCNVPEVIMCYHLDGIVRKYEPIKTEDLPNLKDSKFSPKVIRNVAQNILSFLKSNATKAGHTYWLFKGTNDDVVKLYDLTTLCDSPGNHSDQNPFTVPVAMLLYRVARNMKHPCQAGQIKMLLENCIKLLPVKQYPHIVASSHFMLANLYIPSDTNPTSPNFKSSTGECECGDPETCRRQEGYDDESTSTGVQYSKTEQNFMNMVDSSKHNRDSNIDKSKRLGKEQLISGDVAIHSLLAPNNRFSSSQTPPPVITKKLEERCLLALQHVRNGLSAIKFYSFGKTDGETKQNIVKEEQNPKMAKSYEPIPMGYKSENLGNDRATPSQENDAESEVDAKVDRSSRRRKRDNKNKKKAMSDGHNKSSDGTDVKQMIDGILFKKDDTLPTWKDTSCIDDVSWKLRIKILLYEKACLSCTALAAHYFAEGHYGLSFKYINIAQMCKKILNGILNNVGVEDYNILGRMGDNLFQFAKHWNKYESDYLAQIDTLSESERDMITEISEDMEKYANISKTKDFSFEFNSPVDVENSIFMSGECYSKALKIAPKEHKEEMLRRIASVKNELGLIYMYNAQDKFLSQCNEPEKEDNKNEQSYKTLCKKSIECLLESAKIFEQVKDIPNLALLHCNIGRFMRFKAHCNQENHSPEQRKFYNIAIDHYGQALRLLANENSDSIRELVRWELSSALFTQACLLQDSPPNSPDAANEAIEALRLAIKNCPIVEGPRQCLYQFRAGMLHHRLASLYHNQVRDPASESTKTKAAAVLSKLNYEQAVKLFLPLEDVTMFLTVQLEHVALTEFQANNSPGLKLKCLQSALSLLLQCEPVLKLILDRDLTKPLQNLKNENKEKPEHDSEDDMQGEYKLLSLFEQRLQYVLKNLVQVCMQKPNTWKKENEHLISYYKISYSQTLKIDKFDKNQCRQFASCLYGLLLKINNHKTSDL